MDSKAEFQLGRRELETLTKNDFIASEIGKSEIDHHFPILQHAYATLLWETPILWQELPQHEKEEIQQLLNKSGKPPDTASSLAKDWLNYFNNCSKFRTLFSKETENLNLLAVRATLVFNLIFAAFAKECSAVTPVRVDSLLSAIPHDYCTQGWSRFHLKPYSATTEKARRIAWQYVSTTRLAGATVIIASEELSHISLKEARVITQAQLLKATRTKSRDSLSISRASIDNDALQELFNQFN